MDLNKKYIYKKTWDIIFSSKTRLFNNKVGLLFLDTLFLYVHTFNRNDQNLATHLKKTLVRY